jgi:azurin
MKTTTYLSLFAFALAAPCMAAKDPMQVAIRTLTAQMKFDQTEIIVPPGERVVMKFENPDDMPHNIVFCKPGTDVEKLVLTMLEKPEEAMKRDFIPDDPRVWLKSRLLAPHESQILEFTAPQETGEYPFVCSFPGHAATMRGSLRVLGEGPTLTQLKYSLYLGSWEKLPDFSTLTPHRSGDVPKNVINLNFDDYKNQYGIVFTASLEAPEDGEYTFYLASDDGGRLSIDGAKVVEHDGIHPSSVKNGKRRLKKGPHAFKLEYFQAASQAELFAGWKGSNFDVTAFSSWKPKTWRTPNSQNGEEYFGLPLTPTDAPIIYRNFITGAGNRGIGVGFPGGFNLAWSAETMNLAIAWRGAFIDAARHWRNRGGGHQPPAGFDAVRPTDLVPPLAVVSDAAAPWPSFTPDQPLKDYTWKGYTLDALGVPTFRYAWMGVEVEDTFTAQGDFKSGGKLVRTLKLKGKIPANAQLLLAQEADIQLSEGAFQIKGQKLALPNMRSENHISLLAEGASIRGRSLMLPAKEEIRITYSWPSPNLHGAHVIPKP